VQESPSQRDPDVEEQKAQTLSTQVLEAQLESNVQAYPPQISESEVLQDVQTPPTQVLDMHSALVVQV
jgi:hypothetical protein